MDRYEVPRTTHIIALHGGLNIAIIMDRYEGPSLPLQYPCMEDTT
jgi:hypothetical protein